MRRLKSIFLYLGLSVFLIVVDRCTKIWSINNLEMHENQDFINGVLSFVLVKNEGAAFGMGQGQQQIFIIIALVVVAIILLWIFIKRKHGFFEVLSLSLITAGALGNAIDRITNAYVVDFIQFEFIKFPVFNFADICVCVGVALFVIVVIAELIRDSIDAKQ